MVEKCELCQKKISLPDYVVYLYRGRDIYLCKECESRYQTANSETVSQDKVEESQQYFQDLLFEDKPTDVGALFIQENVLGETIDPNELTQEVRSKIDVTEKPSGIESKSSFSGFLRVLAWIVWIGGLVISIAGAQVTRITSSYYNYTEFSFVSFLTLYATYLINGALLYGLATVVDKISETHEMMKEIKQKLDKLQ